jgi:hypothetical protein
MLKLSLKANDWEALVVGDGEVATVGAPIAFIAETEAEIPAAQVGPYASSVRTFIEPQTRHSRGAWPHA